MSTGTRHSARIANRQVVDLTEPATPEEVIEIQSDEEDDQKKRR